MQASCIHCIKTVPEGTAMWQRANSSLGNLESGKVNKSSFMQRRCWLFNALSETGQDFYGVFIGLLLTIARGGNTNVRQVLNGQIKHRYRHPYKRYRKDYRFNNYSLSWIDKSIETESTQVVARDHTRRIKTVTIWYKISPVEPALYHNQSANYNVGSPNGCQLESQLFYFWFS